MRLYDGVRKTLYSGLIKYVHSFAERNQYEIQYVKPDDFLPNNFVYGDIERWLETLNPQSRNEAITIRDYQSDAIFNAINDERILLLSPTASGKSLIIYSILRWHLEHNRKCILIVPTTSLVEQMYADFEDYSSANGWSVDTHCQKLYSGFSKDFTKDVLITTWQSVYLQPKSWFKQFNVIFGDEAHQFKAKSLTSIMEKMDNVQYRIGTTGTLDNKKIHQLVLEGVFGPLYKVTTTKKLMDSGKLAKLNIMCVLLKYYEEIR